MRFLLPILFLAAAGAVAQTPAKNSRTLAQVEAELLDVFVRQVFSKYDQEKDWTHRADEYVRADYMPRYAQLFQQIVTREGRDRLVEVIFVLETLVRDSPVDIYLGIEKFVLEPLRSIQCEEALTDHQG